ncbi:A disintegrin and metalloproteinase with thrombospondin motifs 7-like [Uloborus diversus]|uniref:A disintegrin and metalloproteinase with thrombospondin motifs 7-like n=1 Tax=Uloborus diversus TaxID=327109 RepID=UPI002409FE43|nr:A disintegrin and metalloproteinase with thrombospondin motifs 7-like [Uloborus diversus]
MAQVMRPAAGPDKYMVSSLYHDASIGNAINIVLVRLILLETEDQEKAEDLTISQHADDTLRSFCRWQKFVNPKDDNHPNHHDVAVLLTRYNICTKVNEPCSTLGLAEVAGMCQPHRSCNVNEDTGLALAYTVAHEMGHNFGMAHDGPHNGCQAPSGERQHVMSPHLNSDTSPLVWSNCSRNEITKFLDRDWGNCLDDEPSDHEFFFPQLPPGAMYDANHQCRLQYGPDAEHCEGIEDVCQTLWCRQDNKCVTRLEPAAEGTLCDKNMWCQMGRCTEIGEHPEAIDGEWGQWGPWSPCSRTCGAGVTLSQRHCDNPMPAGGGRYCIGERKRYKICNAEACQESAPSFRSSQCSTYDSVPYKEELHRWLPVATPMTPCQLHCKPEGKFFSVMLSDTVADGTECNPGTRDVCINGKCRHVACDWAIDSEAQEDRCGVCHGDGTQCLTMRGNFTLRIGLGYVQIILVPSGSRNIRVDEQKEATNYLAVQGESGEFYLNGRWFIQWSGEYKAAGTTLYYQRDGEKESLHIPGPTKENLRILLLYQTENPGVTYEYTIPNKNVTRKPEFHWSHADWTVCSTSCGGGSQLAKPKCVEKEAGLVEDKYCDASIKPAEKTRPCNKHQCPAKWWAGPWQHCSVSCGQNGIRKRTVICVRSLNRDQQIALLDEDCEALVRPADTEPCPHKKPCHGELDSWTASQWSDVCSMDPCNFQSRHVYCSHPDGHCKEEEKPMARRPCANVTCGVWVVGNWSECSTSCGKGMKKRNVTCRGGTPCHQATEPLTIEECQNQACPQPDEKSNFISEDEVMPKKHGHKHRHGHDQKSNPKKSSRPRFVAKDIIQIPIIELESKESTEEEDSTMDNEIEPPQIRKEPELIPYIFGDDDNYEDDDSENSNNKYSWKVSVWTKCSSRCDGGSRKRDAVCLDTVSKHVVVEELCDPFRRPITLEACNTEPCLDWIISEWSQCSAKCGEGEMHRDVNCPKRYHCNPDTKPEERATCFLKPCIDWVDGPWSHCSTTCGGGVQIRHVKCVNMTSQSPATGCSLELKPNHRQPCNLDPCPDSKLAFSECRDKMESSLCKSLRHMCETGYFKEKCCRTCTKRNRPKRPHPRERNHVPS